MRQRISKNRIFTLSTESKSKHALTEKQKFNQNTNTTLVNGNRCARIFCFTVNPNYKFSLKRNAFDFISAR